MNWRQHRRYGDIGKKTVEEAISEAGRTSLFELGGIEVVLQRQFTDRFLYARYELTKATNSSNILVPRGSAPFGQHLSAGLRDSQFLKLNSFSLVLDRC